MPIYRPDGRITDSEEIFKRHFPENRGKRVVGVTDMDYSMFDADLGILVFLEKLYDEKFWDFPVGIFRRLLMPLGYRRILFEGSKNMHPATKESEGLDPALCRLALDLADDLVSLYALIRKTLSGSTEDNRKSRVINEFARKMLELDRIFLKLDGFLSKKFDGLLLMRTRFFAGMEKSEVGRLTGKVMSRTRESLDSVIPLGIYEENRTDASQRVSAEEIADAHGEESQFTEIDRIVTPINDVSDFVRYAIQEAGIQTAIVTANLERIARSATRRSVYHYMRRNGSTFIIGSRLRSEKQYLAPDLAGKPVFGRKKAQEAVDFAVANRKVVGFAIGDNPNTDGPMLQIARASGGIALVVGPDLESTKRRFHSTFNPQMFSDENTYYITEGA
jgi:phosphoserine phosphatase